MFFNKIKRERMLARAFQKVFFDENNKLTNEAKMIICFLRDEAGARGELGRNGVPYFYDANNCFDVNSAGFLLGKRRMFDLIVKYLSLDEMELFRLSEKVKRDDDDIKIELEV